MVLQTKEKKTGFGYRPDVQEGYRSYSDDVFEEEPDEYRLNVFGGVYCGTFRGWLRRISFRRASKITCSVRCIFLVILKHNIV